MSNDLHKMICSHCDTVEHFASVPLEWRCDTCDYMNGYNNKNLASRKEVKFSGGKYISTEFKKLDTGKNRLSLIEPIFIENIGKTLTMGAEEYGAGNWKTLPDEELYRYQDALLRHINAYFKGEANDPETGMSHLYHAACNLMFLDYFDRHKSKK